MNYPSSEPFPLTGKNGIDAMTTGYVWDLDSNRTITWTLADGFDGEYWINASLVQENLSSVFQMIEYFIDVDFQYGGYWVDPESAYYAGSDLTISLGQVGGVFDSLYTWAIGLFPGTDYNYYPGAPGDIFLNIDSPANNLDYLPGSAGYALAIHEIGHALGLKHPHDDGGTGRPTYDELGLEDFDNDVFTVMSYNDDYDWNRKLWDPAAYMFLDVLALQYLYGENETTNTGDSFHALYNTQLYATLWDVNGQDAIDVDEQNLSWTIDLSVMETSAGKKVGFAAPTYDLEILDSPRTLYWLIGDYEDIIGSNYSDSLLGNDLDNLILGMSGDDELYGREGSDRFYGGNGQDFIDGGLGIDTEYFFNDRANYTINLFRGLTQVFGPVEDGTDTLVNVERFQFNDLSVAFDIDGNAGTTAKILGAVFGPESVANKSYVGIGLSLLDGGMTAEELASLAVSAAGISTYVGVVDTLWGNLVGTYPTDAQAAPYVSMLHNGSMSVGELTMFAADLDLNEENIDLIGIAQTGLDYFPIA